jgi:hypothetical protein
MEAMGIQTLMKHEAPSLRSLADRMNIQPGKLICAGIGTNKNARGCGRFCLARGKKIISSGRR